MLDLVIAAALLQAGPDPCHAVPQGTTTRSCPPWRLAARFERFEIFANRASLVRRGSTFEISLRLVYPTDRPRGMRSAVSRNRFDCAGRTSALLHITTYNAAGAVLDARDSLAGERAPQPAPAGSPNAALLDELCPR